MSGCILFLSLCPDPGVKETAKKELKGWDVAELWKAYLACMRPVFYPQRREREGEGETEGKEKVKGREGGWSKDLKL